MAEAAQSGKASDLDRRFMAAALRLGRREMGRTFPNPAVGAIIARTDGGQTRVVGRGWTQAGGRPHAEAMALDEAGEAARGATIYVTLEPCSHQSPRGPACSHSLIEAGVARVVSAMEDPDPRVAGSGHAVLRQAGIQVVTGVLEAEAKAAHRGHILRATQHRPAVILKLAVSADGMIGKNEGGRLLVSGKPAFDRVQMIRTECDAVMVGIGTVLVDDPRLNARHPGMESYSPIRVILDRDARLPLSSNLVASAHDVPLWVVVAANAPSERKGTLAAAGVEVIEVRDSAAGVDLPQALAALAERGLTRVLAEGGSHVASSLLSGGFADEVILFRAPVVVGPDGVRAFAGHALSAVERSPRYRLVEDVEVGEDRMRRYLRAG